jgi:hypothetical protein
MDRVTMAMRSAVRKHRKPYSFLAGVLSIPLAFAMLHIGFEYVRNYVQPAHPGMFSGLGEALLVFMGVSIAASIVNALALWSAVADRETPIVEQQSTRALYL